MVEGERKVDHQIFLYYHSLCSILEDMKQDLVAFVDFYLYHQVITDHEHQPEQGVLVLIIIINTHVLIYVA